MPFVKDLSLGALPGDDFNSKFESMTRQLNEWAREISNEKIATVQNGDDGNVRIVQGAQDVNGTRIVGTLYYDNSGIPRIFIGLHPITGEPGNWITKDGIDVIAELIA